MSVLARYASKSTCLQGRAFWNLPLIWCPVYGCL